MEEPVEQTEAVRCNGRRLQVLRLVVSGVFAFALFWHNDVFRGGHILYENKLFLWPLLAACISGWTKKWRAFVLFSVLGALFVVSEMLDVLIYFARWLEVGESLSPFAMKLYWTHLLIAAGLGGYLTARCVSMGAIPPDRGRDLTALRAWLVAATLVLLVRAVDAPSIVRGDNSNMMLYWPDILLLPTAVAAVLAWMGRFRPAVAVGLATQVAHVYFGVRLLAPLFFLQKPSFAVPGRVILNVVEAIAMAVFVARFARYAFVDEPGLTPRRSS